MSGRISHYTGYCASESCTNQLPINAQKNRLYCNECQIDRKKLQLAVIIKRKKETKILQELPFVS